MHHTIIDSHIHLDVYPEKDQENILQDLEKHQIEALIAVSQHLASAEINLALAKRNTSIKPAFGFHPEQTLPADSEIAELQQFIEKNQSKMIAVGEVGLPYYLRKKNHAFSLEAYIEILDLFIEQAAQLNKPIVLHAVYEDAPIVCELLEKYSYHKAHFHWFKGDQKTIQHMAKNGYYISITPDVLYEEEIQYLVKTYPLSQMMVETDGPWPFKGPFTNTMTHPKMLHESIRKIAAIKQMEISGVYGRLYNNTKRFYDL
ncbi:TatD family hydrolase [Virgibacillus alimentarius]|uniref:TatD DNase family protein n=1 Tax=Virgibacillus alimentarius TaxID=698769 RepID=A0ABS4S8W0_9BACI|nr:MULTISPECIES: TatD family hydrolase [Virgibacillus]MBP2257924.1 TatD DNase family protein [Virgibacillus alimentarius]HLR69461.1 TatD family hydrolase [Virgibacillus sp.]